MKSERLYAAIGAADDDLLVRAESARKAPTRVWLKFSSLAACLCLIALGAILMFKPTTPDSSGRPVLQWSAQISAADYFKYNNGSDEGVLKSDQLAYPPYADSRSFSDKRNSFEADGVIPVLPEHPMFDCTVYYNNDDSIYSIVFLWQRRPVLGIEHIDDVYSELSITAGYQEIAQITDCIFVELDDDGNIVEPAITVTVRDGIQIVAEGNENRGKTITFQNESGWYQISGSWNDSYEPMVELLDWIWEHPLDFTLFPIEAGDNFTSITLNEKPEAFGGYIPDFAAYGFIEQTNYLSLKNGEPYAYEGQFIAHVPEELVKDGNYYDIEGWTIIHWCIMTNPDYYYIAESLGELSGLTEQAVLSRFDSSRNQSSFAFTWDGLFIKVYSNTAQELWGVIQNLQ